jgi:hypothetical protein
MRDRICQFKIENPLTPERRKALDKFLKGKKIENMSSYEWDGEDDHTLRIVTQPVEWEVRFTPHRVTIHATAPLWAWVLLTDDKKELIEDEVREGLRATGFMEHDEESGKTKSSALV